MVAQWLTVGWRYHRIKKRIVADPSSKTYVDDATRPVSIDEMENDELVSVFADKIPDTYGAPKGSAAVAVVRGFEARGARVRRRQPNCLATVLPISTTVRPFEVNTS